MNMYRQIKEQCGAPIRMNSPHREIQHAIKCHHCSPHISIGLKLSILYRIASREKGTFNSSREPTELTDDGPARPHRETMYA